MLPPELVHHETVMDVLRFDIEQNMEFVSAPEYALATIIIVLGHFRARALNLAMNGRHACMLRNRLCIA